MSGEKRQPPPSLIVGGIAALVGLASYIVGGQTQRQLTYCKRAKKLPKNEELTTKSNGVVVISGKRVKCDSPLPLEYPDGRKSNYKGLVVERTRKTESRLIESNKLETTVDSTHKSWVENPYVEHKYKVQKLFKDEEKVQKIHIRGRDFGEAVGDQMLVPFCLETTPIGSTRQVLETTVSHIDRQSTRSPEPGAPEPKKPKTRIPVNEIIEIKYLPTKSEMTMFGDFTADSELRFRPKYITERPAEHHIQSLKDTVQTSSTVSKIAIGVVVAVAVIEIVRYGIRWFNENKQIAEEGQQEDEEGK